MDNTDDKSQKSVFLRAYFYSELCKEHISWEWGLILHRRDVLGIFWSK